MPKIEAPTVAEHRARRLRALLDAAQALVSEQGATALTLGALAARVGLSRPSVYEYFRSRDDLVAAIIEDEIPRWAHELGVAIAAVTDPRDKVIAFVTTELRMFHDGRHAAAVVLSSHALGDAARERVRAEHERLLAPLVDALRDADVAEPALRARMIQGIINTATSAMTAHDAEAVTRAAIDQCVHGIGPRDAVGGSGSNDPAGGGNNAD